MAMMRDKKNKGKYALRIMGRKAQYFKESGTHDDGTGESAPRAVTVTSISEARHFESFNRAEAMRQLLLDRYGIRAMVIEVEDRRGGRSR